MARHASGADTPSPASERPLARGACGRLFRRLLAQPLPGGGRGGARLPVGSGGVPLAPGRSWGRTGGAGAARSRRKPAGLKASTAPARGGGGGADSPAGRPPQRAQAAPAEARGGGPSARSAARLPGGLGALPHDPKQLPDSPAEAERPPGAQRSGAPVTEHHGAALTRSRPPRRQAYRWLAAVPLATGAAGRGGRPASAPADNDAPTTDQAIRSSAR